MPVVNIDITATREYADKPVLWRLTRLFNVVTNLRRGLATPDYARLNVDLEGSAPEIAQAQEYLRSIGLTGTQADAAQAAAPERAIDTSHSIEVGLRSVTAEQLTASLLYRIGKDFNVVVNIVRAAFEEAQGGSLDVTLSGPLMDVQRAISFLHTTGLHVDPRSRCVTDYSNL